MTTLCLSLIFCLFTFVRVPFFLSVLASLSDQLGLGWWRRTLSLTLFVCLFTCCTTNVFVYLLVYLDCLFACSLINLDKLARWVEEEEDSLWQSPVGLRLSVSWLDRTCHIVPASIQCWTICTHSCAKMYTVPELCNDTQNDAYPKPYAIWY